MPVDNLLSLSWTDSSEDESRTKSLQNKDINTQPSGSSSKETVNTDKKSQAVAQKVVQKEPQTQASNGIAGLQLAPFDPLDDVIGLDEKWAGGPVPAPKNKKK